MRASKAALVLVALFVFVIPTPAQAWFGWLDDLSGPGPFNGVEVDFRLVCFMDQPSLERSRIALLNARVLTESLIKHGAKEDPLVNLRKSMDTLTGLALTNGSEALRIAKEIDTISGHLRQLIEQLPTAPEPRIASQDRTRQPAATAAPGKRLDWEAAASAWSDAQRVLREAAVPAKATPKIGFWASCRERLIGEKSPSNGLAIAHQDRHPAISLVLNYRELANTPFLHLKADKPLPSNSGYANDKPIHLQILEPKLVWPLSGRFDFLDGQAGAGIYWFHSAGFQEGSHVISGLVVEPIRFDLHTPASVLDHNPTFLKRLLASVSYSAGVLLFPGGFSSTSFNAVPGLARDISGGEAIFEQGIVINVGRVLGF